VGGFDFVKPDGNVAPVYPSQLRKGIPPPFSAEPTGGGGIRMHHKFVVVDFDKPTARVYLGSYNFSSPADTKNGENLLRIRDRRIAVSFMVEALRATTTTSGSARARPTRRASRSCSESPRASPATFRGGRGTTQTPAGSGTANSSPDPSARVRWRKWARRT
jgi:phosphatidylserine/phosphatidylglycerophosphate/cardiolipin synthase-like enzyme